MSPFSLPKSVSRVAFVLFGVLLASLAALYGIIVFYPQNNPYDEIKIEIPKGATLAEIGRRLNDYHIVSNRKLFLMAVRTLGYETDIPAGTFTLKQANNNYRIIRQLVKGTPLLKKVTVLEGWTMRQIAALLEKELGVKAEEFLALCHDSQLARRLGIPATNLEGFLFPETYFFYDGTDPLTIVTTMVDEYKEAVQAEVRARGAVLGLSELEVITLASIIEGEAIFDSERPIISAVYHNRLKLGMKLQADPTIQYLIEDGPRRLLKRDLQIDSPYNTYLYHGLPPGPINSPGRESIRAALYPADSDYLYFVARGDGYHTFSRTQVEHNRAKRKFQQVRRKVRRMQQQKYSG
jgi:UPF0755 protein